MVLLMFPAIGYGYWVFGFIISFIHYVPRHTGVGKPAGHRP